MIDVFCTCGCGDRLNTSFASGLHLKKSTEDCLYLGEAAPAQNAFGLGSQAVVEALDQTMNIIETKSLRV